MKKIYRFTATWCNPCKMLAKTLETLEQENNDLNYEIIVIDIDQNQDMCEKYNIRGVPTLVDIDTGDTLVGNKSLEELREWLNS